MSDPKEKKENPRAKNAAKRDEALAEYMRVAKAKKQKSKDYEPDPLQGQMLISIGRMEYDSVKMKGVMDWSFASIKLPFHKDCAALDMVTKCCDSVWGKADNNYDYFLADGSGIAIDSSSFNISLPDGSTDALPWTLNNYLRVSSIKYPSRLRLYCVRKHKDRVAAGVAADTVAADTVAANTVAADTACASLGTNGHFEVTFKTKKKSLYCPKYSFLSGTQQSLLGYHFFDDIERMMDIREVLEDSNESEHLFEDNPLHFGFYLDSIYDNENTLFFLDNTCQDSGDMTYLTPQEGSTFNIWSGCYAICRVALLACVAVNGFHGIAAYTWQWENTAIGNTTPLHYCSAPGVYSCDVLCGSYSAVCQFKVEASEVNLTVEITSSSQSESESYLTRNEPDGIQTEVEISSEASDVWVYNSGSAIRKVEDTGSALLCDSKAIIQSCERPMSVELLGLLGTGAFGQVFKAVWRGTIVAAKVICTASENAKCISNELNVYKTLHHPNVLTFMGMVEEPGKVIIITNFVDGMNLYDLLHSNKKIDLSFNEKVYVIQQMTQALVFMHGYDPPIVHLDLKPENILVEKSTYHVYLADFGLGKITLGAGRTTMKAGTPAFQPPEQLKGESCGTGSDVYALGCITTEVFGGKPIWSGLAPHTIILKVAGGNFPNIDHLPPKVKSIVQRCFRKESDRISALEVLRALCAI